MRPILAFLFVITLLSVNVLSAQENTKFRVFEIKTVDKDSDGDITNVSTKKVDDLVVVRKDKKRIDIYTSPMVSFDFVAEPYKKKSANDADVIKVNAVDKDGLKCIVRIIDFKDKTPPHVATIYVDYSDTTLIYYLKDYN